MNHLATAAACSLRRCGGVRLRSVQSALIHRSASHGIVGMTHILTTCMFHVLSGDLEVDVPPRGNCIVRRFAFSFLWVALLGVPAVARPSTPTIPGSASTGVSYSTHNFALYPWLKFLSCGEALDWSHQKGAYPASAEHGRGWCEHNNSDVVAGPPTITKAYPWLSCRRALTEYYDTNEYPALAEHGMFWCQAYLGPENVKLFMREAH
jgi:hypothetical protein